MQLKLKLSAGGRGFDFNLPLKLYLLNLPHSGMLVAGSG